MFRIDSKTTRGFFSEKAAKESNHEGKIPRREETPGPFLVNLTEPLCAQDHLSHGLNTANIDATLGRVNTIDVGSRALNNNDRGTNEHTGRILFDQILIPAWMSDCYVANSIKVFDNPVAVRGNNQRRASDHVPVYADFVFGSEGGDTPDPTPSGIRIVSLLPNPAGRDAGHKEITIGNFTQNPVTLNGWKLEDRDGNEYALSGTMPANTKLTFIMTSNRMPLNNSGDDVRLFDQNIQEKHNVTYPASDVKSGKVIKFE